MNGAHHLKKISILNIKLTCCYLAMLPNYFIILISFVYMTINSILIHNWQSKNGGLAAWEPAGAQEWLEVKTLVTRCHVLHAHLLRLNKFNPLFFLYMI